MVDPVRAPSHRCAVLGSVEHASEALAEFVADGIEQQEQVIIAGLPDAQATHLLQRLHEEDGVDPDPAITDGQLVVMTQAMSDSFLALLADDLTGQVTGQVEHALRAGYRGVRLTGRYPGAGIGLYEHALDELVRAVPLTVLCPYFRTDLTGPEIEQVRAVHGAEVLDTAIYDDGSLRITRPRTGWLRVAGRWDTGNHHAAFTVIAEAAAAGDRDLDLSSLRSIDPAGVHALLTGIGGGLRLRHPNPQVRRLTELLATRRQPTTDHPIDKGCW